MEQPFQVFSFARFSSGRQAFGESEKRQIQKALAYAAKMGWKINTALVDRKRSALHGRHMAPGGSLRRFFDWVEAGVVKPGDKLIFEGFDRFSRQPERVALSNFLLLINAGIEIHTTIDEQVFSAETIDKNPGQLHMTIGLMLGAHKESANRGQRIVHHWVGRRETVHGTCPAWLEIADRTLVNGKMAGGRYKVRRDTQKVLVRIFEMCRDGFGLDSIARVLNGESVPCLCTRKRSNTGWYSSYLRKLITTKHVLGYTEECSYLKGVRQRSGKWVQRYPAAISEDLWKAANAALASRRGATGRNASRFSNLFTRLATCGTCGGFMKWEHKSRKLVKPYVYLRCYGGGRGVCENTEYHRYDRVEKIVLSDWLLGVGGMLARPRPPQPAENDSALAGARDRVRDLEQRIEKLMDDAEILGMAEVSGRIKQRQAELETARKALERLERETAPPVDHQARVKTIFDLQAAAQAGDVAARTRIAGALRDVIEKIECHPDKSVVIHLRGFDGVAFSVDATDQRYLTINNRRVPVSHAGVYTPKD